MRRALSIELEEHLVNQVLKVEDGRFSYTDDALVFVARILIIRTSTGSGLGDYTRRNFSASHRNRLFRIMGISCDTKCYKCE